MTTATKERVIRLVSELEAERAKRAEMKAALEAAAEENLRLKKEMVRRECL